jgi:hypothetical protein
MSILIPIPNPNLNTYFWSLVISFQKFNIPVSVCDTIVACACVRVPFFDIVRLGKS